MVDRQNIYVANDTPYPIAATVRVPTMAKGVLMINAGTCIKRSFYDGVAAFFASKGYVTVQYDYVGVGGSRPMNLKNVDRSIYDWGASDMQTMSDWIDHNYPNMNKYILGHSMGGQIVGLMPSINSFKKVLTVASSYGNVRNFEAPIRELRMRISLYTLFPLLNKLYGYFPANLLGMGMDWPYGVAEQWRLWNTRYLSLREWMDRLAMKHYFDGISVPMISYILTDDTMATEKCIPHFMIDYPNTVMKVVEPGDYGVAELGHFKSFKPQSVLFWTELLAVLESED